jgi:Acetyltransferase (GNAT) domain
LLGKFAFKWVPRSEIELLVSEVKSSSNSNQHYFLSSTWAKRYLAAWSNDEWLGGVIVEGFNDDGSTTPAFVALSIEKRRSKIGISFLSIGFNEASSTQLKYVTPEINGLFLQDRVATPQEFVETVAGTVDLLSTRAIDWGEIRLNAVPAEYALAVKRWAKDLNLNIHDVDIKKTYVTNLADIRSRGLESFIESRSSNSRAQLRKARRLVEASHGPIEIEMAQNQVQLDRWFDALKQLHRLRWGSTENGSGFDYTPFDQFHTSVASDLLKQEIMHLWRIRAGEIDLAYLHIFAVGKCAYFNISGINYDVSSAFKPGLLAHSLVIQHYLESGFDAYDFMVGTNQYKQSLSTDIQDLHFFSIRQSKPTFHLEALLRTFKRAVLSRKALNAPGAG